ncbi:MAG: hypothetical protein K2K89_03610 [Ruminococcus sp.]|nr:hypothetical protein [Ruminococcus sp.]
MRKTRFFIMAFVLVGIMFLLSGCAYYSSSFDFEFKGEYMADKYVDLLIPLDETDEFYTDYNCNIEGDIKIPENSEIVKYNKDGFRSMLMHIKDADLNISICDSESMPDCSEKYNGNPFEIRQWVGVPYYEGRYDDPYNEEMFLEFCNKYKKCRVAVFDSDGNILQISKKIPIVSLKNFYLQDISYNVEKNKIKPHYIESSDILVFYIIVWLLMQVGMVGCLIILIVDKIRQNKPIVSYKGYIIASSICNIPAVVLIITYIYCAFGISSIIVSSFITLLIISVFSVSATVGTLMHFIRFEKKLCMKKYLEKNLDISGKM